LDLFRQALELKPGDELRPEAILTITSPEVRAVYEIPFVQVVWDHPSPVLSPDLSLVAASTKGEDGKATVRVCELRSGRVLQDLEGYAALGFRPGTKQLAVKSNQEIVLWDLDTRSKVARFPIADSAVFSPDGAFLASYEKNGIRIWNVQNGQERPAPPPSAYGHFVSGHEMLLTLGARSYGWDVATGRETFTWPPIPAGLTCWAVSANGRVAFTWGRLSDAEPEGFVLWDVPGNQRLGAFPGVDRKAVRIHLGSDGRRLALGSWDNSQFNIKITDTSSGVPIRRLLLLGAVPRSFDGFELSPDCSLIGANEVRGGLFGHSLWDVESGSHLANLPDVQFVRWVSDWMFLAEGTTRLSSKRNDLLSTSEWTSAQFETYGVKRLRGPKSTHHILWEVTPGAPSRVLDAAVESLSFNRDGSRLIANDVVWVVTRRGGHVTLRRDSVPVDGTFPVFRGKDELWWTDLPMWARDDYVREQVVVGRFGSDGLKVILPNPGYPELEKNENERLKNYPAKDLGWPNAIPGRYRLEFGPEGNTFLLASEISYRQAKETGFHGIGQHCLELWDATAPKRLALWATAIEWQDFRFTSDGRRVIAQSHGQLVVWDVKRGTVANKLPVHSSVLFALSADGKTVLAVDGKDQTTARLFDLETHTELRSWPVERMAWQVAALGPTVGHVIASGGDDGTIRLWDGASGLERARWQAHDSRVTALAFSPDGNLLVSGGDGTVKVWDLPFIRKELAALDLDW
jgi:WD40 repeat protein